MHEALGVEGDGRLGDVDAQTQPFIEVGLGIAQMLGEGRCRAIGK